MLRKHSYIPYGMKNYKESMYNIYNNKEVLLKSQTNVGLNNEYKYNNMHMI